MLAGAAAVVRTAAGSVLVEAAGVESQRNALGSGPVRSGCLSLAGTGQRMAPAPRVGSPPTLSDQEILSVTRLLPPTRPQTGSYPVGSAAAGCCPWPRLASVPRRPAVGFSPA